MNKAIVAAITAIVMSSAVMADNAVKGAHVDTGIKEYKCNVPKPPRNNVPDHHSCR